MIWNPYRGEAQPADLPSAQPRGPNSTTRASNRCRPASATCSTSCGCPRWRLLGFCLGGRYACCWPPGQTARRLRALLSVDPGADVAEPDLDAIALAADIQCPVQLIHGTATGVVHAVFLKLRDVL